MSQLNDVTSSCHVIDGRPTRHQLTTFSHTRRHTHTRTQTSGDEGPLSLSSVPVSSKCSKNLQKCPKLLWLKSPDDCTTRARHLKFKTVPERHCGAKVAHSTCPQNRAWIGPRTHTHTHTHTGTGTPWHSGAVCRHFTQLSHSEVMHASRISLSAAVAVESPTYSRCGTACLHCLYGPYADKGTVKS